MTLMFLIIIILFLFSTIELLNWLNHVYGCCWLLSVVIENVVVYVFLLNVLEWNEGWMFWNEMRLFGRNKRFKVTIFWSKLISVLRTNVWNLSKFRTKQTFDWMKQMFDQTNQPNILLLFDVTNQICCFKYSLSVHPFIVSLIVVNYVVKKFVIVYVCT
jgi:hypothetical protein